MTDTVTGFYHAILTLPSVDPEMQRQVYRHGTRRGDHSLLAALAARPDLIDELDRTLGEIDAALVKVAWASRANRTEEDLLKLVVGEKRVKVLAALASREDVPDQLYSAIAEFGRGSSLEALMSNQKVSPETKETAARRFGSEFSAKTKVTSATQGMLSTDPAVADIIAASTQNFLLASAALTAAGPGASKDAQRNAVTLGNIFVLDPDNDAWNAMVAYENVGEHVAGSLERDDAIVAEFCAGARRAANARKNQWSKERMSKLASDVEKIGPNHGSTIDFGAVARAVSNAAEAETFIMSVPQQLPSSALLAVAKNSAFTGEQFKRVLTISRYSWYSTRDLAWVFPKLEASKAAALVACWGFFDDDSQLGRHPAPSEVLVHVAQMSQDDHRIPTSLYRSKYITDDVIDHLPLSIYDDNRQQVPLQVTERLAARVSARLGNDPAKWENLNALSNGFTGSLNNLLEVATSL
jgi:hypothetical protein